MNILFILKTLFQAEASKIKKMLYGPPPDSSLLTSVDRARREWQLALKEMNYVDMDMAEYIIFKINAAERHYMNMLEQAKKERITAWPPLEGQSPFTSRGTVPL